MKKMVALAVLMAGLGQAMPAAAAPVKALQPSCDMIALNPGSSVAFAKLDGITGNSTAQRHAGEIDVTALRFCVSKAPVGNALLGGVVLDKTVDSATPQLISAAETAKPINTARITVEKPGPETSTEFLRLDLTGVRVEDSIVNTETHGVGEEVNLTARRLQVTTTTGTKKVTSCFDFTLQKVC
jgi:type VI protein secretion system component Hcp